VKKWTLGLSKENLEFYALQLPKEPWFVTAYVELYVYVRVCEVC
jgi:hypothetical protein